MLSEYADCPYRVDRQAGAVLRRRWRHARSTPTTSRPRPAGRPTRTAPTPPPPAQWERGDPAATTSSGAKQLGTTVSGTNDLVTGAAGRRGRGRLRHRRRHDQHPVAGDHAAGDRHADAVFSYYLAHGIQLLVGGLLPGQRRAQWSAPRRCSTGRGGDQPQRRLGGRRTANLSAYAGQTVRILVEAADASTASLVEAGVDDVRITQS